MAYRLARKDASVESALRRIASEQIDAAVHAIDDPSVAPEAAIHELRKRCKKVRGLLRLVRPSFEEFRHENAAFRGIASAVSGARDGGVLVSTYDVLVTHYSDQVDRPALAAIRRGLTLRLNARAAVQDPADLLAQCRDELLQAARRSQTWRLQEDGFAALEDGLRRTYKRARSAMRDARSSPSPEQFHEWRKRCKYHWYHARLLRPIWPGPMRAYADCAGALGDVLGQHHDLAVFERAITREPEGLGSSAGIEVMAGLARSRQETLESQAVGLGTRLLALSPSALAGSWGIRFEAWRDERSRGAGRLKCPEA